MKIRFNGKSVRGLGTDAVLIPGINDVSEDVMVKWAKDTEIRALIEDGTIAEVDAPKDAPKAAPKARRKGKGDVEADDKAEGAETSTSA